MLLLNETWRMFVLTAFLEALGLASGFRRPSMLDLPGVLSKAAVDMNKSSNV